MTTPGEDEDRDAPRQAFASLDSDSVFSGGERTLAFSLKMNTAMKAITQQTGVV